MKILQRFAMWLVWNVPLGKYAPSVFDFAMGQKWVKIK